MDRRITNKVSVGEPQEGGRRREAASLKMNECSGELNQAPVERPLRFVPLWKPKLLQDFVRLEKELLVETFEKAQVMRIQILAVEPLDYRRDFFVLLAHEFTLKPEPEIPK